MGVANDEGKNRNDGLGRHETDAEELALYLVDEKCEAICS